MSEVLTQLDELALAANQEHELARQSGAAMVEHAIRAGQALEAAKGQVEHGQWLPWLSKNFKGSTSTADRYRLVAANSPRVGNLETDALSLRAVVKRIERINREEKADKVRSKGVEPVTAIGPIESRHGDLRSSLDDLAGQVDAIITDPPYEAAAVEEFDALGELALRLLAPKGILAVMTGQTYLPEYLERLSRHLAYRWTGAYLTEGPATRIHPRKIGTKWKPILLFDRGDDRQFLTQDVFTSGGDDKQHHHWGQSESGMADLVAHLTLPGQLVVDPFAGAGTTAIVCRDLGRRFVGCDVDAAAVDTTRKRLAA